ncbi:MAG: hypothetical protein KatS3mg085_400 [Candidatus Dojkabacteria bacterium]|nr:MAG: hypothetical protein KatS3mg085_400 [Candidatus Dojkabacteria bacterium]
MNDFIVKPKTKKQQQREEIIKNLKLFVLPLFTFLVFIAILFFFVIPKLQILFEHAEEINIKNQEIKKNNEELADLDSVFQQVPVIENQLSEVEEIASSGDTKIVEYRNRVVKLAQDNGLVVKSERLNEVVEARIPDDLSQTNFISRLGLQEVPAFFEFRGSLNNLKEFLTELDTLPDFVIIKELDFNIANASEVNFRDQEWALEIQLVKYQFRVKDEELKDLYRNIPINVQINDRIIEYLTNRS